MLTLNSGDTIGLVGRNGEGKTTLLRLLCGSESPTTGIIIWKKYKIGYLDQILIIDNEKVYTCLKSVFGELNIISEQLKLLEEK